MGPLQHQLEMALVALGLVSDQDQWQVLTGGQSNFVWRVTGTADFVVKLFTSTESNPIYANTPQAEYDCLIALQGSGIAPDPIAFEETDVGFVLIYSFLHGDIWQSNVPEVSALLKRLHIHTPAKGLRMIPTTGDYVHDQAAEILEGLSGRLVERIRDAEPSRAIVKEVEPCFVHTDVVVGNLVSTVDGLRLIDWQCPAIGDPVIDIAMFLSPAMHSIYGDRQLSLAEEAEFLLQFDEEIQSRYATLANQYHWRMAAYCAWRADQGVSRYGLAAEIELARLTLNE
jgi:thiamine kinase-like enzyme